MLNIKISKTITKKKCFEYLTVLSSQINEIAIYAIYQNHFKSIILKEDRTNYRNMWRKLFFKLSMKICQFIVIIILRMALILFCSLWLEISGINARAELCNCAFSTIWSFLWNSSDRMDRGRKFEVLQGLKMILKFVEIYPAIWIFRNIKISIPLIFRPFLSLIILFQFTTLWLCFSFG